MSDKRGIFFDEWQACLRAHYKFVIQDNDTVTEPTLRAVLLQTGLTEGDLEALIDEALAEQPPQPADEPVEGVGSAANGPQVVDEDDDEDDNDDDNDDDGQMALF